MPKYDLLDKQEFIYAYQDIKKHYLEKGSFIAVKMIEHFVQIVAKGGKITFSNETLVGMYRCSLSGLQDAFKILERDGIIRRTFKDASKNNRSEFIVDLEKALLWLSVTKYDKEYQDAPKRSLFKAFVNQSVLLVKNVSKRIRTELKAIKGKLDKTAREAKINEIKSKLDKEYQRYIKHLESRTEKIAAKKDQLEHDQLQKEANETLRTLLVNLGYRPPTGAIN